MKMTLPTNQIKKIEEKLRYYDKPFIEISLLQKIIDKFAPNYQIKELSRQGFISPIIRGELYLNLLSRESIKLISTTILAQYSQGKTYAVGGLYLYNRYHFSEQLANKITVYNTNIHGERKIAGYQFIFQKVRPSFFRGIEQTDAQGYGKYNCMTKERALIQLIKDTNGKMEYSDDIYHEIESGKVSKNKLISLAKRYTSKKTQTLVKNFLQEGQI